MAALRGWLERFATAAKAAAPDIRDLHVYGGGALVAVGVGMAWTPGGGLVVMGSLLVYIGLRR